MFDYVRNEYNPDPVLVLDPEPTRKGYFVRNLPYTVSLCVWLPRTEGELRAMHGRKYWQTLGRKERRLGENVPNVGFRVVRDTEELREALPKVQEVFARRWADEYTTCPWKTPEGFAPYAEAMVALAARGRAELAVLEGDGRILSFVYGLLDGRTFRFYQHACLPDEKYRRYSVGKILVAKLLADLVADRRCDLLDFMTGEAEYKRAWTTDQQQIYYQVAEPRTPVGAVRFVGRLVYRRARLAVQFGHPGVRAVAKQLMLTCSRIAARVRPAPDSSMRAGRSPTRQTRVTNVGGFRVSP